MELEGGLLTPWALHVEVQVNHVLFRIGRGLGDVQFKDPKRVTAVVVAFEIGEIGGILFSQKFVVHGLTDDVLARFAVTVPETNKLGFPVAGLPPYRLEVLLRLKGLEFDAAKLRASTVDLAGLKVAVIHPHDLIRTKRLAGRPKDLADAYGLVGRYGEPDD